MFADLHIHTNFSDGIYSPKEIINQAIIYQVAQNVVVVEEKEKIKLLQ